MSLPPRLPSPPRRHRNAELGSVLLVAMLLAIAIAFGLIGFLSLGRTSLKLAQRTFFASDAGNLAEAGLEEAVYCFNLLGTGASTATAWTGWTISGTDAMRTLLPFNRDQNAVGIVKVFVHGCDGSNAAPYVIAQASIVPFDGGAPVVKILQIGLRKSVGAISGVVALNGLTMKNQSSSDSFNSNPSKSPTGPWLPYSATIAGTNGAVSVAAGSISLGTGKIFGDLNLGAGVAAPPASQVTGVIRTNVSTAFSLPVYPTSASVSKSYSLGSSIPATLPVAGHLPASDGRYYYFCSGATIGATTITTGKNVTIVGTTTKMSSGLVMQAQATCFIYIDQQITLAGGNDINSGDWAGALRIYTTTTTACTFGNKSQFVGCLNAPNAALQASGTDVSNLLVGSFVAKTITVSGSYNFHYDEALGLGGSGASWALTSWFELQSAVDRKTVGALTGNFLP